MSEHLTHLKELEAESIYILREVAAQFERPCILFSGGKDSIVLTYLAYNFPETITYRDDLVKKLGADLIVGYVQDSIDEGKVKEETGFNASRNKLQTVTLLDTLAKYKFDAACGGARRDEEKARAKERIFSHRDEFGQWNPKNQRPELWDIYNGMKNPGEHFRVFPISNWTEMDVWQYIYQEGIELPSLYYTHTRKVFFRDGQWLAAEPAVILRRPEEVVEEKEVRCRTIGDITCTGLTLSHAHKIEDIIDEIASSRVTERGGRADDKRSETAMEDRKKAGYF